MNYGDKKVVKCQTKTDEEKGIQLFAEDVWCQQDCLQRVDKKAIVASIRGMEQINKNGIREFFLDSLLQTN